MFNPKDAVQSLLDDAYRSGSALAEAIFPYAPVPEDRAWHEQIRDQHCEALVRSLSASQHFNPEALAQGIFASAFSGFEDQWRHMAMPAEDAEAIAQAGEEMMAGIQTGIFDSPDEGHGEPLFDGANPEQEGLAVQFAHETVLGSLSPARVLEMARELYQAESAGR